MRELDVALLALGMDERRGPYAPTLLSTLPNGRSILHQQIDNVRRVFGEAARITVVVTHQFEKVARHVDNVAFVMNHRFRETNTSKSLLRALVEAGTGPFYWMTGDIVFHPDVLARLRASVDLGESAIAARPEHVIDGKMRYRQCTQGGNICDLSGAIPVDLSTGEAVGMGGLTPDDKPVVLRNLQECDNFDYFERGLQMSVQRDELRLMPIDVVDLYAIKVESGEDLTQARAAYSHHDSSRHGSTGL